MPSSHSDRARRALFDIRENIVLAATFLGTATVADLMEDRRTFYAVTRCLEIISEAARRVGPELRRRHPDLPWRAIMGLGNVYRHGYDNVDEIQVWRTVRQSLPALAGVVDIEIGDDGTR